MKIATGLSRNIAVGFLLALALLIVIGIVSVYSTIRFAESAEVVNRSYRILSELQATLADLGSAESEARGFVMTGDEQYLGQYETALRDMQVSLGELRSLARDKVITERLAELGRLVEARIERLRIIVERKKEGTLIPRQSAGPGKKLMDELRGVAAEIEKRQDDLLTERARDARALARRTIVVVIAGSVFAVLLVGASVFLLLKDITHRERLEKEVLEISEREQRRIGQDLHDGLCQQLTGISLLSRSLQQQLDGPSADATGRVTRLINECIEQTRRVTRGLHPVPDEPTGLQIALQELAESVCTTSGLACRFDCPQPVPIPDQVAATNLYRIAQEAVQNALKHAGARSIEITLRADEENITLSVSDDGRGLPEQHSREGLGLEIMSYRVNAIGAKLALDRRESGGTSVTSVLPRDSLQ
jgi:signal transduction histidine kinase